MEGILSESWLLDVVGLLVRVVEAGAAIVIFVGAVWGFIQFCVAAAKGRGASSFTRVRMSMGRYLALGLEFQLASDLLGTAVAPTYEQIGKVAAIAAIRTALNFFLARELAEQEKAIGVQAEPP